MPESVQLPDVVPNQVGQRRWVHTAPWVILAHEGQAFIALLLVLLNGFFVAAEFSIVKVRYSQIQIKAAEGNKMAKQAEHIIKHLDAYLSATQLGITLASLALGWVGESALEHVFHGVFSYFNINIAPTMITTISVVVSFLIITVMHIVFGELVPKSIAIRKSEATTLFISAPFAMTT